MSILFRFIWVIVAAYFKPALKFGDISVLPQRVWPIDLDINMHMNNARYLSVMDLGRTDWIVRSGAWRLMRRDKMAPVVGGCLVRYRRSLRPFETYLLKTRLLGWDERWIYVEQIMQGRDGIACLAVQRTAFVQAGKIIPVAEWAAKIGYDGPQVPVPDWVAAWSDSERTFVEQSEQFAW